VKLNPKDAKEMKEKLAKLDLMKMKSEQIVKVIDILPEDKEDLNKIFANVNLDEDETKKILDPVKEYK
jgi:DNA-directed RNA polymerase subunit F